MNPITPLVVTPRPMVGESLRGFILRTSEMNGYETPLDMLSASGMSYGEMRSKIPPLDKLAALYGRTAEDLSCLGYDRPWNDRFMRTAPIAHHMLPTAYQRTQNPRFCTECILEHGFIEAFWDLRHAVVCPVHGSIALQSCPECGKPFDWSRPGLLTCPCGCDLSAYRGSVIENSAIVALMQIVRAKLLNLPLDHAPLGKDLGFPVEHLETMSLGTLIGIIGRIEGRPEIANRYSRPRKSVLTADKILERAAGALSYWPHGLYEYLWKLEEEDGAKKGFGLRKQFESFFGSIFKSGLPGDEVAFIRDAFVRFGREEWKQGYVTPALDRGTGQGRRLVGIYGLARALGVMPSTARSLVSRGEILGTSVTANGRTRLLFDLNQHLPFQVQVADGDTLTVRTAASCLGIPVSVLRCLRQQGVFEVRHLARPTTAFHERDVQAFRLKLSAACPNILVRHSSECISLAQVMAMKSGSPDIKASVVAALLNGTLYPLGKAEQDGETAVFERSEVESFVRTLKEKHFGAMTVVAASRILHCDPVVVKQLFQDGVLAGKSEPRGILIECDAVSRFAEQYISCASIASGLGTQSTAVVEMCVQLQVPILWVERGKKQRPQPFVERNSAAQNNFMHIMHMHA